VNHFGLDRRSPDDTASIQRNWMLFEVFLRFERKAMARGDSKEIAVT
jgi:hypothetical protein